jgi:hypothetical protein
MRNEPKGYNGDKENIRLPKINDKSNLAKGGAAILAAGNRYSPQLGAASKNKNVL